MNEKNLPLDDLGDLAEQVMADKGEGSRDENRVRELYDVPSEDPGALAREQMADGSDRSPAAEQ